jgi:serine/threonine protein phosphatase 1
MSLTYVVPDLHGRLDLLDEGLRRISAHAAGQPGTVILLGDYVDKGPDSGPVVDRLLQGLELSGLADGWRFVALKGNHDAMMVEALRDPANMASWIEKGGDAALASYGGDPAAVPPAHVAVPQAHIEWLDRLPLLHLDRHRLYVHAGVDAGISLGEQTEKTLLNKRYPPDERSGFDGLHVVHGHDNFPEGPLLYQGRSNLDTQAWRTGRLVIGIFDDAKEGGPLELIEIKGAPAAR